MNLEAEVAVSFMLLLNCFPEEDDKNHEIPMNNLRTITITSDFPNKGLTTTCLHRRSFLGKKN
jgi:hypothetical protein